jgi:NDP-sugar pyrophosphorylase family protein
MKAMVLAAGLGTRLRPLTNDRPKALVEIAGQTPLEITLKRLHKFGIHEVIINAHHHADMLIDYVKEHKGFGMWVEISREEELLDTGGGLKKAAEFFLSGTGEEPFLVHNVDVISTIDFASMLQFHTEHQALATIESSRYLLFDNSFQLCGRKFVKEDRTELARPAAPLQELAFSGIHVISPRLLKMMTEEGAFSIIATYLRLSSQGEKILAFSVAEYYWRDLGTPESISAAAAELQSGQISL